MQQATVKKQTKSEFNIPFLISTNTIYTKRQYFNHELCMNLEQQLLQVYQEEANERDTEFAQPNNLLMLKRMIEAFDIYKEYLHGKSRFLDWGCKNAETSYLIQSYLPEQVEIHGCDIERGKYTKFSQEANLIYTDLIHSYQLPYSDNYFDVVVGNGVLEHVVNDAESLKELHRVIKEDGYLIITFLPNHLSYTEFLNRNITHVAPHLRLYSIREIKRMLIHTGFVPVKWGYHQMLPSLSSLGRSVSPSAAKLLPTLNQIYKLNKYAEKVWLLNKLSSNIFVIAQRKVMI